MPYVTEYGAYLGSIFKFVWDILKEVWHLLGPVLIPTFKIIVQWARILMELAKIIFKIFVGLAKILVEIVKAPFRLLEVLTGGALKVKQIIDKMMEFVTGMQVTFQLLGIYIDAVVDKVVGSIDRLIWKFREFYKEHKKVIDVLVGLGTGGISGVGGKGFKVQTYKTKAEADIAREAAAEKRKKSTFLQRLWGGEFEYNPIILDEETMKKSEEVNDAQRKKLKEFLKNEVLGGFKPIDSVLTPEEEKRYQEEKNKEKEEDPGQKGVYINKQINTKIEITVPPFIRDLNPLIDTGRFIG
jgi:hypothetical protein